jgi:carboxylesterase type B
VTIFGHSAGGSSVALHLSAPYSYQNNYFQRAIVQSNPFTIRFHDVGRGHFLQMKKRKRSFSFSLRLS